LFEKSQALEITTIDTWRFKGLFFEVLLLVVGTLLLVVGTLLLVVEIFYSFYWNFNINIF